MPDILFNKRLKKEILLDQRLIGKMLNRSLCQNNETIVVCSEQLLKYECMPYDNFKYQLL